MIKEVMKQEQDEPDDLTIAYMAGLYDGKKQVKQEQGEPVGKFAKFTDGIWREVTDGSAGVPLYTHPKEWVGLTDQDMNDPKTHNLDFILGARWAEEILKERNT